jgi:hypothetical protein
MKYTRIVEAAVVVLEVEVEMVLLGEMAALD